MADYIDKGALLEQLAKQLSYLRKTYGNYDHYTDGYEDAFDVADDFMPADVVEVVRCKECKHRNPYGSKCLRDNLWHDDEDYCSYGERKEQE